MPYYLSEGILNIVFPFLVECGRTHHTVIHAHDDISAISTLGSTTSPTLALDRLKIGP
jgi:hypothetical protein